MQANPIPVGAARGAGALDLCFHRWDETYVASGRMSQQIGPFNKTTGEYGSTFGVENTNLGNQALALGNQNSIGNGINSGMAIGFDCDINADASFGFGSKATTTISGQFAFGAADGSGGYRQSSFFIEFATTINATPTVLAGAAVSRLVLPVDTTWAFSILLVARRTDADNESAAYEFVGCIDRNAPASSTALVGTVTKTVLAEDTAAWDADVDADTTNGALRITVTGEASKTIRWVAFIRTVEVTG